MASMIEQINQHSQDSVEINVFKKILQNEVDEKFFWFLQNIKTQMKQKVQFYYKDKVRKNANLEDMNNFFSKKISQGISSFEGKHLIGQSYSGSEFAKVKQSFQTYFSQNSILKGKVSKLSYKKFLEFIFNYELQKHLQYLKIVSEFFND